MNKSLILFFLAFLCSTSSVWAESVNDYIREGNRLYRSKSYDDAFVKYKKALDLDTTSAVAHYNLGNCWMQQNKLDSALIEYTAAIKFEKSKGRQAIIYHNMGVVNQKNHRLDVALENYKNALRRAPHDNDTRYNLILCQYQLKKNKQQKQDEKQQNKDQQDKDKKDKQDQQNKDQQKQQDKKDQQNSGQQNQQDKQQQENRQKQQQKNNQSQQKKPNEGEMSKQNAEQILQSVMQQDKNVQGKIQKVPTSGQRQLQKQW